VGVDVLLSLACSLDGKRAALGSLDDDNALSFDELDEQSSSGAQVFTAADVSHVAFIGTHGRAFTTAVFAGSKAGLPLVPLNYRLSDERLIGLADRIDRPLVMVDTEMAHRVPKRFRTITSEEFLRCCVDEPNSAATTQPAEQDTAVLLFTSGTTGEPKAVVLRHEHLTSYILTTNDLASAATSDCALISVPPYHIAGVAAVLSNAYVARRVVHLTDFTPHEWLRIVRDERVTSAMVVPTMLARIVDYLGDGVADTPTLRTLSYGGARLAAPVLEKALRCFPETGFTNAYGLTETSSTLAVLGPEDHRAAVASADPYIRKRLSSVGKPVPGIEIQVRGETRPALGADEQGELFVRGPQVAGEYLGIGSVLDAEGWFATRDQARVDRDGYLYIEGRIDDTIIRGGENISPAEIEGVLISHPGITDAAVVGLPDDEWGERVYAAVQPRPGWSLDGDELRSWARKHLRGFMTPERIAVWPELPYTASGKLLRRDVAAALTAERLVVCVADPPHGRTGNSGKEEGDSP
jgi:acyl-CoA synthetase (AMP-forming)/AMP-acid ligase II